MIRSEPGMWSIVGWSMGLILTYWDGVICASIFIGKLSASFVMAGSAEWEAWDN